MSRSLALPRGSLLAAALLCASSSMVRAQDFEGGYMVLKLSDVERMADSLVRRNSTGESNLTATGRKEQSELMKKGAFPLKVTDTTGAMIWEVIALEERKLDASLFVPPADFRRMEMPSFGRPPQ